MKRIKKEVNKNNNTLYQPNTDINLDNYFMPNNYKLSTFIIDKTKKEDISNKKNTKKNNINNKASSMPKINNSSTKNNNNNIIINNLHLYKINNFILLKIIKNKKIIFLLIQLNIYLIP